jgi:flagellar biosynthesis/type III secretory pathway protein FliH
LSEPLVRPLLLPELRGRAAASTPAGGAGVVEGGPAMVREGHRIARSIIARATAQAREVHAAAEEQGREAGRREALEREGAALRSAARALTDAAARLEAGHRELRQALEAALPELGIAIAARVLRRELTIRPELLVHVVRDALAVVTPATTVEVRLHPADIDTVQRHREALGEPLAGAELRLEADPAVGRGGCRIETDSLTLAAGIPQQLERALELLTGVEP